MSNEPTRVTLLNQQGEEIFSVTESHPESLNARGSEATRSITIEGPADCVVTCFDDQQFRMGQNSVQITKTIAGPVTVPIAQDFVSGQQRNGVFFGTAPEYKWQFSKAIETSLWGDVVSLGWDAVQKFLVSQPTWLKVVLDGAEGYVSELDGTTSSNNHVDNLSSIKFGL